MLRTVLLMIILFGLSNDLIAAEPLKIMTHSIEGHTFVDDKGHIRGKLHGGKRAFLVELVSEMQKRVETGPLNLISTPYNRGWRDVRSQPNVAFFNVSRTSNREGLVKWVGPLVNEVTMLYEATARPVGVSSREEAKKVDSICVLSGNSDDEFLMVNGFTNIYRHKSYAECFKMLVNGRVDLAVIDSANVHEVLSEVNIDESSINAAAVLYESNGYLAISNNVADTEVKKWQEALNDMKRKGLYYQLLETYYEPQ